MHELSITQSVVDAVLEHVPDQRVIIVRLSVGRLSGVVPEAMRFCFELVTAGTRLEGAELEIEQPDGAAHCEACGSDFALSDLVLLCACGSADVRVRAGRDLRIRSVEVA